MLFELFPRQSFLTKTLAPQFQPPEIYIHTSSSAKIDA
jgi:hypothetical protein